MINWSEFEKVDMGVMVDAPEFPDAKEPAYRLWVDLGPLGVKRSSAQLTDRYRLAGLMGRQVVCVVNFRPKQVGPFVSEVLMMGAYTKSREDPAPTSPPGSKIG